MIELNEQKISPPKFPVSIVVNGAIVDYYLDNFLSSNIPPGIAWVVTSGYRTVQKNNEVGGALNSAHIHNLARDIVLMKDSKKLSNAETQQVFEQNIKPNWKGFSLNEGDHIHLNLSRRISTASNIFSASLIAIIGINIFQQFKNKRTKKR